MIQEYRFSKKLIVILVISLMGFGMLPYLSLDHDKPDSPMVFLYSWAAVWWCMAAFAWIEYFRWKLTVDNIEIRLSSTFSTHSLLLEEIKGYRNLPHGIVLEAIDAQVKPLKIGVYFKGSEAFGAWVEANFQDLDSMEVAAAHAAAIADEKLGDTESLRESRLSQYKTLVGVLAFVSYALLLGSLFYEHLLLAAFLLPAACYWLMWRSNGWITPEIKKGSGSVNLTLALLVSCWTVGISAAIHTPDLVNWKPLLPWYLTGAALFFAPLIYLLKKFGQFKTNTGTVVMLGLIMALPYGIGLSLYVNYHGNRPKVAGYQTIISGKRFNKGKHTSYYLEFLPAGPLKNKTETEVGSRRYEHSQQGDTVLIGFGKGALGAVWYQLYRS